MGSDDDVQSKRDPMAMPELGVTAATVAPPLSQCRVAIVTTAALVPPEGSVDVWMPGDQSFTVLADHERNLRVTHCSPNFDRTGVAADLNVVYPVDRLHELAAAGVIGSVAPQHLSFMGAQADLTTIQMDTGRAAAALLREDDVDVVLLTPI